MLTLVAGGGRKAVPSVAPVAGVAVALRVERQPSGAEDGVAFTTQPRVEVIDGYGDRVTGSTAEITATKATGSGTLAGDTAVSAVSGLATFVDLEIGGTGDHSLTFSATGLAPATSSVFDVTASGAGDLTPQFFSDWSYATGTSSGAYTDNGKWTVIGGFTHNIIATTGLDFPAGMANCFQVISDASNDGFCYLRTTGMPIPAVGVTRYYRIYTRMVFSDLLRGARSDPPGLMNGDHPWKDGNTASGANFLVGVTYGDGEWWPSFIAIGNGNYFLDINIPLSKGATYRIEWAITRASTTQYTVQMRVYDSSNTLIADEDDFILSGGSALLGDATLTYNNVNVQDGFGTGANDFFDGVAGEDDWEVESPMTYAYMGGHAVADDQGFIGAYGSVTGEA